MFHDLLDSLKSYDQWILWEMQTRKNGKGENVPVKVPIDPHTLTNSRAIADQKGFSFVDVEKASQLPGYNIGFIFTERDPFFFLDVDKAYSQEGWSEIAQQAAGHFKGCYVELSQSRTGLHIIGTRSSDVDHKTKNTPLGIELYTKDRFVALTGFDAKGDPSVDASAAFEFWAESFFKRDNKEVSKITDFVDAPCEGYTGPEDDDKLIERAMKAQSNASLFGGGATFKQLWENDEDELAKHFPSETDTYGRSEADASLARMLSFWTGKNSGRILRLMNRSGLVRDKWVNHNTYLQNTISFTISQTDKFYDKPKEDDKAKKIIEEGESKGVKVREAFAQFLPPSTQIEHFKGYTYIRDLHRVLSPDGALLKPEQFKVEKGGHEFALDFDNNKTTSDAFKAFTESQAIDYDIAHGVGFDPRKDADEIYFDGKLRVNTWRPCTIPSEPGDVTPFYDLLDKLFPDQSDRQIIMAYLAACVQYQGHKFQWCPLIQGVQGNGKTFLSRAVSSAINPEYVYWPRASDLCSKFNLWLLNKTFIAVEDIYVSSDRHDFMEILKPMITSDEGFEIQGKGMDQVNARICCNFILNSNHKDALPIDRDERRFAIFYTPQQSSRDLADWGMTPDYYHRLYDWFRNQGGHRYTNHLLMNYDIPDILNPAKTSQRAPKTSSSVEANESARGPIEQALHEAIEQQLPGFRGGWIASSAAEDYLMETRGKVGVSIQKLRSIITKLKDGYIRHPGLPDGRVNNPVPPGNKRTVLFCAVDHPSAKLDKAGEISALYLGAQGFPDMGFSLVQ